MNTTVFGLALTLICALSGALLAQAIGLPSAWLLGSMGASVLAALLKWPVKFPLWLQNVTVFVIAINVGGALDIEALPALWRWLPSLLGMLLSLWLTFMAISWMLRRLGGFDKDSAFLAAYPGHLVLVLQVARNFTTDIHRITMLQSLRVLSLVAILPAALHGMPLNEVNLHEAQTDWQAIPVIVIAALSGIVLAGWIRMPAALMIGAIVGATVASFAGFSFGSLPVQAEHAILLLTGAMIGTRFVNADLRTLANILPVSLLAVILALCLSAMAAFPISKLVDVPFGQLLLAYAPGGAEVMAIIAMTIGYDPSFVGLHHVIRLLIMAIALPFFSQGVGRYRY
ncbi:MAG: AbrB family transcriptional regulator [Billgrantia sp.]